MGGGTILATADAGATWIRQTPGSITDLKPASGKRGALVTIMGRGFGVAQAVSSVQFGTETCTDYVSWSDARIKCKVPGTAIFGVARVTLITTTGTSYARSFTVKR